VLDRDVGGLIASLKAPIAVFRNPDLRRLELAWAAMSFASWSFAIAIAVYAFDAAGAGAVGLVALLRLLPGAIAAPFAGLLGDTRSRRGVLLTSSAATAVVLAAATVAAATGRAPAIVFCTAAGLAVAMAAYPPVESALLPQLARTPQELSAANVALSTMDNGGFLVGAIGAGVLLALGGPEVVFGLAAVLAAAATALLLRLTPDRRPDYVDQPPLAQVARQTLSGGSTIFADARLRLLAATLTILVFFEGAIDVLVVIAALELLDLGESSVGYLNAAWGIGALAAGAAVAVLLYRGKLALGIGAGSLVIGAAATLMAAWPVAAAAYVGLAAFGVGYTLVEVATKTFLQRLGSDEVLARVFGFMETSRLAAMALGSIVAPLLVALLGTRGALVAAGALPVLFAAVRWGSLRDFETGAPVDWHRYALLRNNQIFQPLPVATLERLCQDLEPIELADGVEVITQGGGGERFYLIEEGEVAVFRDGTLRRSEGIGESFGEIALIRDVPRTATVRVTRRAKLLTLEREQFVAAVTGYPRSKQLTEDLIDTHLGSREAEETESARSGAG
jgi:MFS family permease